MVRDPKDQARLAMDRQVRDLLKKTDSRRQSTLSTDTPTEGQEAATPWEIVSKEQLRQWITTKPEELLQMIGDLRFERDQFRLAAEQYEITVTNLETAHKHTTSAEDRAGRYRRERNTLQQENNTLRAQVEVESEDKDEAAEPADRQPDRERRQEQRPARIDKSSKLPDPPMFTNGIDPTWEDWVAKILEKILVNGDHFPTSESQVAYISSRIGGEASGHTLNRRRLGATKPYTSSQDILKHLQEIYEDGNREESATISHRALTQVNNQTFQEFYHEFVRLGEIIGATNQQLRTDLKQKVVPRLRSAIHIHDPFTDLRSLKNYLKHVDLSQRADFEEKAAVRTTTRKTAVTASTRVSAPATTYSTLSQALVPKPFIKQEVGISGRCFGCGKTGHFRGDCPEKGQNGAGKKAQDEARIHELGLGIDDAHAQNGSEQASSSDSGNE